MVQEQVVNQGSKVTTGTGTSCVSLIFGLYKRSYADRMNIPQISQLLNGNSNSRSTTYVSTTSHRKGKQGFVSDGSSIILIVQTSSNTKDAATAEESKGVS